MALYWKVPHYSHFSIYETTPERMMNQMIFKWIQSAISLTHALARLQQSLSRQILRSRIGSPWANTGPVLYTTRTLLLLLGSINKNILLHIHLPQRFCAFLSMPLNEWQEQCFVFGNSSEAFILVATIATNSNPNIGMGAMFTILHLS